MGQLRLGIIRMSLWAMLAAASGACVALIACLTPPTKRAIRLGLAPYEAYIDVSCGVLAFAGIILYAVARSPRRYPQCWSRLKGPVPTRRYASS